MSRSNTIGAVIIGRNEGDRLVRCLASMGDQIEAVVYVDSGSTDGSVEQAQRVGADVVLLDIDRPFTAARARNAGLAHLQNCKTPPDLIQFIDGDCELRADWLQTATAFLETRDDVAVVCGRRRERFPDSTIYNRLIDAEWDTPIGETKACGGDALMRLSALQEVGGYNPSLIAGEEPELCVRLRQAGWKIWRLDAEMTWHDAAITRLEQWWKRAKRAGHAFAEGAALHGDPPERHYVAPTRRALVWGAGIPVLALLGLFWSPLSLLILGLWPLQIIRLALRDGDWAQSLFLTLSKVPEAFGALSYYKKRLTHQRSELIEYK